MAEASFSYLFPMTFLPDLDREWRGEMPDDFWLEMFQHASREHQEQIHSEMQRCGLTCREATQKLYKCDEAHALADTIPDTWSKPVFSHDVTHILDQATMDMLVEASHAHPDRFDEAILLRQFLRGPRDIQWGDRALQRLS